uniref:Uncharacterized protein n=1 Tax=Globodera pallida TaxID=36090 RepID=A0A183CF28_GLOPA
MIFLFGETSSNSQHQNPSNFWHDLTKENGIWDEQMVVEMDKSDSFIEKLSKEENYKKLPSPNKLQHSAKQSLFFNLFKLDNFYELVNVKAKIVEASDAPTPALYISQVNR